MRTPLFFFSQSCFFFLFLRLPAATAVFGLLLFIVTMIVVMIHSANSPVQARQVEKYGFRVWASGFLLLQLTFLFQSFVPASGKIQLLTRHAFLAWWRVAK